ARACPPSTPGTPPTPAPNSARTPSSTPSSAPTGSAASTKRYHRGSVTASRRFSQAISEGDGISLVAAVGAPDEARTAEGAGAEAVLVWSGRERDLRAIRAATSLPILFYWDGEHAAALEGADACLVEARGERDRDLVEHAHLELADRFELALQIEDEEHLAAALEDFDPEVFVLAAREDDDEEPLEQVLDLL